MQFTVTEDDRIVLATDDRAAALAEYRWRIRRGYAVALLNHEGEVILAHVGW